MLALGVATVALARAQNAAGFETQSLSLATTTPQGGEEQIPAELLRPSGEGHHPAIVIVHDCSGLGPRSSGAPRRWAALLASQGYAILMPDSFSSRDFPDGVCTAPPDTPGEKLRKVSPLQRTYDAYAALAYLRRQDFVDGAHVGIMGGSHGGSTTLAVISRSAAAGATLAREKQQGFAAAIALYPGCGARYGNWSVERGSGDPGPVTAYIGSYQATAPLLILVGSADDWTPAESCQALVDRADQSIPVHIKVYPGARHSFDSPAPMRFIATRRNQNVLGGRGATTGGDPAAWADAIQEVTRFFAITLKGDAKL
jgi:dienelactone hydrolase